MVVTRREGEWGEDKRVKGVKCMVMETRPGGEHTREHTDVVL